MTDEGDGVTGEGDDSTAPEGPVVLFDGVCNLCVGSLPWLIRMDSRERLRFGTLQSGAGERLLETVGLPRSYDESMVVVDEGRAYTESDAVVRLAWLLGVPWALASVASIVPKPVRDRVYGWIAENRYGWFGRRDSCLVPGPELSERFLESSRDGSR